MWIFKADIAGCFNQLHWAKSAVRLMRFVLQAGLLMIMLSVSLELELLPWFGVYLVMQ